MIYLLSIIFIVLGLFIRFLSKKHNQCFSHEIGDVEKIQTSGIYKHIRHPAYLGSMLIFLGLTIVSTEASLMYLVYNFFLSRAIQEEMILMNKDSYLEYMKETGVFLPKIKRGQNGN